MVDVVSTGAYRDQLHALLPRGAAWPREDGTVLDALLDACAVSYAALDNRAVSLLDDVRPDTTVNLLADFERVLALPDDCTPATVTFGERRRAVVDKTTVRAGMATADYLAVASVFGYLDANLLEAHSGAAAAAAGTHSLDVTNGKWRFVWWLILGGDAPQIDYKDCLSGVDEPLAESASVAEITCRVKQLAPAHTYPIVVWVSPLPGPPANFAALGGSGQAVLTWTPVTQTWATSYQYRAMWPGTTSFGIWIDVGGGPAAEMATASGLPPGTHKFQIRTLFPGSPAASDPSETVSAVVT